MSCFLVLRNNKSISFLFLYILHEWFSIYNEKHNNYNSGYTVARLFGLLEIVVEQEECKGEITRLAL